MLDLEAIVGGATRLAALPGSVLRLTAILSSEDWRIADIVHTIQHDQALTGRLLQLANATASGARGRIDSVSDAVLRLGTGPILSLAIGSAVSRDMAASLPGLDEGEGTLWRHSVAAALAVQNAGEHCGPKPPPEAFVAALLHDVGFLALDRWLLGHAEGSARDEARAEIREADHGVLAGLIAARWRLSETTQEALVHHHLPSGAPTEAGRLLAHFTALGDCAARAIGAGFGAEANRLERGTAETLALTRSGFEALCEAAREQLDAVLALYA